MAGTWLCSVSPTLLSPRPLLSFGRLTETPQKRIRAPEGNNATVDIWQFYSKGFAHGSRLCVVFPGVVTDIAVFSLERIIAEKSDTSLTFTVDFATSHPS
jgi:hypothetical protein